MRRRHSFSFVNHESITAHTISLSVKVRKPLYCITINIILLIFKSTSVTKMQKKIYKESRLHIVETKNERSSYIRAILMSKTLIVGHQSWDIK